MRAKNGGKTLFSFFGEEVVLFDYNLASFCLSIGWWDCMAVDLDILKIIDLTSFLTYNHTLTPKVNFFKQP